MAECASTKNLSKCRRCVFVFALQSVDVSGKNRLGYDVTVSGTLHQYTARENDGTGLYYYRARFYDPVLKQFFSEDPIGLLGGLNSRAYVDGNPINYSDPEGLAKAKGPVPPNPNKKPPPPHRVPGGERERNVAHENAEEHSRRPKGGFRNKGGFGGFRGAALACSVIAPACALGAAPCELCELCFEDYECPDDDCKGA